MLGFSKYLCTFVPMYLLYCSFPFITPLYLRYVPPLLFLPIHHTFPPIATTPVSLGISHSPHLTYHTCPISHLLFLLIHCTLLACYLALSTHCPWAPPCHGINTNSSSHRWILLALPPTTTLHPWPAFAVLTR
ncbi:hypothetical protein HD806DRAFT_30657 [Xylariaceae sp. AK1471]|nr:hypothetical protein HD806DRAFT_30657 [Xylariaceae sp. AK1471]